MRSAKCSTAAFLVLWLFPAVHIWNDLVAEYGSRALRVTEKGNFHVNASNHICKCVCEPCQSAQICPTSNCGDLFENPILGKLAAFSAGSSNDEKYKEMWITGAGLFIPLLNELLDKLGYSPSWQTCDDFHKEDVFTEKLMGLYNHYGSDKASYHDYYKVYGDILQKIDVEKPLNLLEIGLGTNNPELISSMGVNGKPGASLRAFRDALPRAHIYGADIDQDILFTEDRIATMQVDQMERKSFAPLGENTRMFDLTIDDGLHSTVANLNTMLWAMDHTRKGGYIVIEDIHRTENWNAIDFIISKTEGWEGRLVKCNGGGLFVLQKLG